MRWSIWTSDSRELINSLLQHGRMQCRFEADCFSLEDSQLLAVLPWFIVPAPILEELELSGGGVSGSIPLAVFIPELLFDGNAPLKLWDTLPEFWILPILSHIRQLEGVALIGPSSLPTIFASCPKLASYLATWSILVQVLDQPSLEARC